MASVLLLLLLPAGAQQKGASITLKARWNGTSYLLESAELLAEEDPALYWQLLGAWSSAASAPEDPADCWPRIVDEASQLLPSGVAKMVPLVLGSRQFSAQVEMYRQLAAQLHPTHVQSACCFVDVDGQVATTLAELQDTLRAALSQQSEGAALGAAQAESSQLFAFDHIYPGPAAEAAPEGEGAGHQVHAVLYGAAGTACFAELHSELLLAVAKAAAAAAAAPAGAGRGLVYAVRPLLSDACQAAASGCSALGSHQDVLLPGYGVEAALKNMEYSAMDDKKKLTEKDKTATPESDATELSELSGFVFSTLAARRPALRQELLTFRDHLASSQDDEDSFKVWDLKDVGLQASQRIMAAQDPLALLAEISQNFPSLVSSLSRQAVNASLRAAVTHNQQYLSPGSSFMLLNGLMVDINNFDYFGLLERLRVEVKLTASLRSLGLGSALSLALLELRAADTSDKLEEARLDLQPLRPVLFLNDLEKDKQYARFSSSLSDILNTYPGRLRPLARNVFTAVFIMDPTSPGAQRVAVLMERLHTEGYPIRLGLAMVVPAALRRVAAARRAPPGTPAPAAPEWTDMTLSEQFARALLALKSAFGVPAAFRLATFFASYEAQYDSEQYTSLYNAFVHAWNGAAGSPTSAKQRVAARKSAVQAWDDVEGGAGYAAEAGSQLLEISEFLLSKGVAGGASEGRVPMMWLNGVLSPLPEGGDTDQDVLYKVMGEMQRVQEAVYYRKIDESDDVLAAILRMNGAVSRWNPVVMAEAPTVSLALVVGLPAAATVHYLFRSLSAGSPPRPHSATHWVVVDAGSEDGRALMVQALRFVSELPASRESRVGFLFNPLPAPAVKGEKAAPSPLLLAEALVQAAAAGCKHATRQQVATFLLSVLQNDLLTPALLAPAAALDFGSALPAALQFGVATAIEAAGMPADVDPLKDLQALLGATASVPAYRALHAQLAWGPLGLAPGVSAVFSNGRRFIAHDPHSSGGGGGGGEAAEGGEPSAAQPLLAEDFALLQLLVSKYQPGEATAQLIADAHDDEDIEGVSAGLGPASLRQLDDMVLGAVSLMAAQQYPDTPNRMPHSTSQQIQQVLGQLRGRAVEVGARDGETAPFHLSAVFNPLTRTAQKLSQVLLLLRTTLGPSMSLYLNPQRDLSDLPLKSFYRYALPDFVPTADGLLPLPSPPGAHFTRLPQKRVLTLNMDVPEPWLVEPVRAPYDLDNLRLADVGERTAYAEYELDALMLTGACLDITTGGVHGTPARGVQLYLGSASAPHIQDTLVMSNLAYFQLKAAPGRWILSLAPGRSQEVYSLESSTGIAGASEGSSAVVATGAASAATTDDVSTQVVISSLTGKHMTLRLRKRPGQERADVLQDGLTAGAREPRQLGDYEEGDEEDEDDDDGGLWGSLTSMLGAGGGGRAAAAEKKAAAQAVALQKASGTKLGGDVVNMFTVASGHMYERLQKIMMLSVIANTKSKVKFWIISNYISPHHKAVIPRIAAHFGFDYQFVTYKWPHWLNKQTDKQRIIWASKILFLDVLFPLDVQRVIFVDSDQIIRTDMADLYHMDIKGAPYAYTPFCDNNKEMDEFRFWKGGFWRDHLAGKPYHISALYLVDLVRFRQTAAGDQLRVIYEQLSKDPNSLANLDQDLPNYAQHQIPIHSLPLEWLWCESWCGNDTKPQARTIDLCNNPRTKEPKLSAARRIVPEWVGYDEQQASITALVEAQLAAEATGSAAAGTTLPAAADAAVAEGVAEDGAGSGEGADGGGGAAGSDAGGGGRGEGGGTMGHGQDHNEL